MVTVRGALRGILGGGLMLLFATAAAHGSQWSTPSGSTTTGGAVDASVSFSVSNGSVTLTLTNLEANPGNVAQCLSAIIFTTSTSTASTGLSSTAGTFVKVNGNTNNDFTETTMNANSAGWVLSNPNNSSIELDVLSGSGHAGPAHTIIGNPGSGPAYSSANSSIINSSHSPFILSSETWTISDSHITTSTTITGVTFQFGTTDNSNQVTGTPQVASTPEPSTLAIGSVGAIALVGYGLKKRRRKIIS
jgi:hypothetical protein